MTAKAHPQQPAALPPSEWPEDTRFENFTTRELNALIQREIWGTPIDLAPLDEGPEGESAETRALTLSLARAVFSKRDPVLFGYATAVAYALAAMDQDLKHKGKSSSALAGVACEFAQRCARAVEEFGITNPHEYGHKLVDIAQTMVGSQDFHP